ncbi:MAG: fumarylacetoacetate hydrolase family protein [Bacteroidales bacterium]|jgi:2-keto-4-pentenoate hydratase/2-oxohepta-3-ene-1,7-dioic acid hydratase in catechol pathway|nr:fumarylacetoacetate hydrolase family protein [Bacteroidales bacterium]
MKIICIGLNYKDHIKELNSAYPENPVFFLKPESSLLRNGKDFYLPGFSENIQYEIEVVLRINRLGKHIQAKFAHRYYDAIGLGIDFTARDLQKKCKENGLPWEISKAFDGSAVISDFIPVEEFRNTENIEFSLYQNENIMQSGNTSDMIFNFSEIIEYISKFMTLKIGDLIYTGTPSGVGKVSIGDNLKAYLNGREMINMKIK